MFMPLHPPGLTGQLPEYPQNKGSKLKLKVRDCFVALLLAMT